MPFEVLKVESTPNPRARKLIVAPAPASIRSYFKPADAAGDPLGEALFAIEGVTNVLIHTGFISVCIAPEAKWPATINRLKEALRTAPGS
ncbi:MAG: NifU N-terminal domain-containing protein [Phycisphaerales bacterium]|nr:NifU N-terminal domain-containing protein [Phycisphaerales bacterium]